MELIIERQDERVITINGKGVECVYYQDENKLKGKGSRKFREEIEEQLISFIDCEAEFSSERYDELADWDSEDEMIDNIKITNPMILKETKFVQDRMWEFEKIVFPTLGGFEITIRVYCNSIQESVDRHTVNRFELKEIIRNTEGTVKLGNDCLF